MRCLIALLMLALLSHTASGQAPSGRAVDLSHAFDADTIFWPTEKGFQFEQGPHGVTEKGYFYSANRFCTAEHGGTHVDAPIHFAAGKNTVDSIPIDQLVGPGVVIDVSAQCERDRDYQVRISDLTAWERRNGAIPKGSIVMFRTGFGRYWPDRARYLGTDERGPGAVAKLHFPGLHVEAARWLVRQRGIKAVGIDTASIDYGQSTHFETHVALMTENVPALENVASLEALPARGFSIVALPMKIKGGSGGPCRIVAFLPK